MVRVWNPQRHACTELLVEYRPSPQPHPDNLSRDQKDQNRKKSVRKPYKEPVSKEIRRFIILLTPLCVG